MPEESSPEERHDDPAMRLRISDEDRNRVADVIRRAAGEGRLEVEELEERLEAAYAAKTYADLAPITRDLPGVPEVTAPASDSVPARRRNYAVTDDTPVHAPPSSIAVLWAQERRGVWAVGESHTAFALCGSVELDLREARFGGQEIILNAHAVMGSVEITVNAWTRVFLEGTGMMGAFEMAREKVPADLGAESPVVRVRGVAVLGAVTVVRKPMPGEKRQRRRRLGH